MAGLSAPCDSLSLFQAAARRLAHSGKPTASNSGPQGLSNFWGALGSGFVAWAVAPLAPAPKLRQTKRFLGLGASARLQEPENTGWPTPLWFGDAISHTQSRRQRCNSSVGFAGWRSEGDHSPRRSGGTPGTRTVHPPCLGVPSPSPECHTRARTSRMISAM